MYTMSNEPAIRTKPILKVRGLDRYFGGLHAVDEVSFDVPDGSIKAVIGPNGAGKTTLFNMIAGTLPPDNGAVDMNGTNLTGLKPYQVASLGVLRTFQNLKLCSHMSVLDNALLGRHTAGSAGFFAGMLALGKSRREEKEAGEKVLEILEWLDIADIKDQEVGNLSFGKQRSVELARLLAAEPTLLLLDEPAAGLNMHETDELAERIVKIRDMGRTVLLVEHDMSLVMDISDEIVVLNFGRKIAEGTPNSIQNNPEVIQIYLGGDE
jgi:branched-chain amino acid transport system ATP-binding protein